MFYSRNFTYGLLTLMLFIPFVAYVFVINAWQPPTYRLYFIVLIYGLAFLYFLGNKFISRPKYLYYYILYIIFIIIWTFFNGEEERRGILAILFNNKEIAILFLILIIYNTHYTIKFLKKSLLIIKITVFIAALASIIQVFDTSFLSAFSYKGITKFQELDLYQFRRPSIFGFADPNEIGLSFIPLLSVLVGVLIYQKNRIYIVFLILGGLIALLSNARYVMIGFLILTLQILIVNKNKILSNFKYIFITGVSLTVLYITLIYLGYNIPNWIGERLWAEGSIQETTRYKAIGTFVTFFPQTPIFGTGVHLTDEIEAASKEIGSSQIHVGYLSYLVSYGIVGCFFLFGFWFHLLINLYKSAKKTNYWGSFFAFLIYFWSQATLVNNSLFFYGLIFALVFDKYFKDSVIKNRMYKDFELTINNY